MAGQIERETVKAHPSIKRPDSVTHLLCPARGTGTHHLRQRSASGGAMTCMYCRATESALRERAIEAGVIR